MLVAVIPAQAGIHLNLESRMGPRLRGDDGLSSSVTCAGMTEI